MSLDEAWETTPRETYTLMDAIYIRRRETAMFTLWQMAGSHITKLPRRVEDLIGEPPFMEEATPADRASADARDAAYSRRIRAYLHRKWPDKYPAPEDDPDGD